MFNYERILNAGLRPNRVFNIDEVIEQKLAKWMLAQGRAQFKHDNLVFDNCRLVYCHLFYRLLGFVED